MSNIKHIDTIDKWHVLKSVMKEKGWQLYQLQYSFDCPEGFHAWFSKKDKEDVEVITFNEEVEKEIVKYNSL